MLREWREKYEREITVRTKNRWAKWLGGRTRKMVRVRPKVPELNGGPDNEFSLTVLFSEIALFSSIFLAFPILSKVLHRVY